MKTIKYDFIDREIKRQWGDGPWVTEPDKVQVMHEATGIPMLAVRHETSGHWCGYAGVAPGHPLHGLDYSACSAKPPCLDEAGEPKFYCDHAPESLLSVHGGITFANKCSESEDGRGVCHVPDPGEPDHVWWFGFDCAHSQDISPGADFGLKQAYKDLEDKGVVLPAMLTRANSPSIPGYHEAYRDLKYVLKNCSSLARQLLKIQCQGELVRVVHGA